MFQRRALAVLTVAATVPFAACGEDEEKSGTSAKPSKVEFELKPDGKKATLTGPETIEAGVAEITLKNSTKKDGGLQFIRVEGDHDAKAALAAGNAWGDKGKPLPKWLLLEGGVPTTGPGKSDAVTQTLEPGKYYAADIESDAVAEVEVTGDGKDQVEAPAAAIDATEYSFKASGLKAGKSEVLFDNKGGQPHFVAGLPMNAGATIADVRTFFKEEKGPPPFSEKGSFDTAVSEGTRKQVVNLDLEKGKYALVCFVPDRQGGPPHALKGMISEAVVQ
jgi:hypothetical protein